MEDEYLYDDGLFASTNIDSDTYANNPPAPNMVRIEGVDYPSDSLEPLPKRKSVSAYSEYSQDSRFPSTKGQAIEVVTNLLNGIPDGVNVQYDIVCSYMGLETQEEVDNRLRRQLKRQNQDREYKLKQFEALKAELNL